MAAKATHGSQLLRGLTRIRPSRTPPHLIFQASALPLSVRADGPARAAAEVQGLDAWRALVPGQPADPDGRLRARVQGAAEGRERSRLPDLPDLGPGRVGVLLAGAVVVGTVACRECAAH